MTVDKTSLTFWFPKIRDAGLPVPRTEIIEMPEAAQRDVWNFFDQKEMDGAFKTFADRVALVAASIGQPCFLRTAFTSGKHNWNDTCFVADAAKIGQHMLSIIEFSEIADMFGMRWDTWVVREFLPTKPLGVCPRYGNMPVCREFRFFVEDGAVRCHHPYWPLHALEQGGVEGVDYDALCRVENEDELRAIAERAGAAVPGAWSIDILETERGWFVTDMAEAGKSFHWEGCVSGPHPIGDA